MRKEKKKRKKYIKGKMGIIYKNTTIKKNCN